MLVALLLRVGQRVIKYSSDGSELTLPFEMLDSGIDFIELVWLYLRDIRLRF